MQLKASVICSLSHIFCIARGIYIVNEGGAPPPKQSEGVMSLKNNKQLLKAWWTTLTGS